MSWSAATLLAGRYRPQQRLAAGGMGEVWRADDTVLGRPVAIKALRRDYADDPGFRGRFRDEARHAARLTHGNVTQVYDFGDGEGDDPPYLVMEYVAGEPLSALLARTGVLDDRQTWSVLGQVAAALDAAHRTGVVHCDVKPGNVIVCPDGRVKVTDFGIARAVDEASVTSTGETLGTASYLAPEQAAGTEPATPATDLYALGVLGYECLAGRPPFDGDVDAVLRAHRLDQPPPLSEDISPALREVVMALLAKDPGDRPADAGAIAAQAQRLAPATGAVPSVHPDPYPTEPVTADLRAPEAGPEATLVIPPAAIEEATAAGRPRRWRVPRRTTLLGVLAAVVAVAAVTVAVTVPSSSPGARHRARPAAPARPARTPREVPVEAAALWHGHDHPQELHFMTDTSPTTAWMTEHYATADFGNLKPGVGVFVRLPARGVRVADIRFALAGVAARLYAADRSAGLLSGRPLASTGSAPLQWRVVLPAPVHARYWLVWITRLVPDGGGYRAGIADLRFLT